MLNRVFGVGLAAAIAALTLVLAVTGRIALYISPDGAWFAVAMAVVALLGAVLSFALPLGAEEDGHAHGASAGGHDHAQDHGHGQEHGHGHAHGREVGGIHSDASRTSENVANFGGFRQNPPNLVTFSDVDARDAGGSRRAAAIASIAGGVLASGVVATALLVPPATLSAELAMSRDTGTPPLFAGADTVALAATGDTASFGIGEWSSVFATTTNPDAFDGTSVTLTGFATTGDDGFRLTRLVVTHCVIDAQPASLPVATADLPETGQWVTVSGVVRDLDGRLTIEPAEVAIVDEPEDPYEF